MKKVILLILLLINYGQAQEAPPRAQTHKEIATRILEDLRMIEAATDQFAIEKNLQAGTKVTPLEIRDYVKKGSKLYDALGNIFGVRDALGNLIGPFIVDQTPRISEATFKTLSTVAGPDFWGPYMCLPKPLPEKEAK